VYVVPEFIRTVTPSDTWSRMGWKFDCVVVVVMVWCSFAIV